MSITTHLLEKIEKKAIEFIENRFLNSLQLSLEHVASSGIKQNPTHPFLNNIRKFVLKNEPETFIPKGTHEDLIIPQKKWYESKAFQKIAGIATGLGIVAFIGNKTLEGTELYRILWQKPDHGTPIAMPKPKSGSDDCIPKVMNILNEYAETDNGVIQALRGAPITADNMCNDAVDEIIWDVSEDPRISDECLAEFLAYWHKHCNKPIPQWPNNLGE